MTFKDLLEQFSFDEIAPAFKTLWQRNAPEQAAYRWEGCVPMIDMNCAVYAKEDNALMMHIRSGPLPKSLSVP